MSLSDITITMKYEQTQDMFAKLESSEPLMDIHKMNLDTLFSFDLAGVLTIIKDEIQKFGTSYYLLKSKGFLQKAIIPLLFADEDLEYLGRVTVVSPQKENRGNQYVFVTNRRLLLAHTTHLLSFWFNIDFSSFLEVLKSKAIVEHTLIEPFESWTMQFSMGNWAFGKQIAIKWYKKPINNMKSEKSPNLFLIRGNVVGKGSYRDSSEKISKKIIEKYENSYTTNFLEILAMENYCLVSEKIFYHPLGNTFKSIPLKHGRLNLGIKKQNQNS